jgi:hypothetical protein
LQPEPVSAETMKVRSNGTRALAVCGQRQQRIADSDPVDLVEDQELRLPHVREDVEDRCRHRP